MPTLSPLRRLISLTVLNNIGVNATRFTLLLYALQLGASNLEAGLVGTVYALIPALAAVRVGSLVDRIGSRTPMLVANGLLAAALLLPGDEHLPVLYLAAALAGTSNNVWFISHQHLVGAYSKAEDRAAGYVASGLGFALAALTGPILAGTSVDLIGHKPTLLLLAVIPLAVGVLLARGVVHFPPPEHRGSEPQGRAITLLREPALRRIFIVGALFECSWTLFGFLVPLLGTALGLTATAIGFVAGSISISTFACRIILPWVVRRIPTWRLLIVALVILTVGYAGMGFATSVALLSAFGMIVGVGQSMGAPLVNALLYEGAPAGRQGQAIALRSSGNYALQMTLPLAGGALASALGAASGFWLLTGLLAAGVWYARGDWRRPSY